MENPQNPIRPEVEALFKKYTDTSIIGIMDEVIPPTDHVYIEENPQNTVKRKSGLWVPGSNDNECIGIIMAVGPDVSLRYQIGQTVRYNQYADLKITLDTRTFIICGQFDIKGVINPNGKTEYYGKGEWAKIKEEFNISQAEKLGSINKKKKIIQGREDLMIPKGKIISYEGDKPSKTKKK